MLDSVLESCFRFAESIAKRYYGYYAPLYALASIQEEDLIQEAKLSTLEEYNKWILCPHTFNLKAHLSVKVGWGTLNRLKRSIMVTTIGVDKSKIDADKSKLLNLIDHLTKKERKISFLVKKKVEFRSILEEASAETEEKSLKEKINIANEKMFHDLYKPEDYKEVLSDIRRKVDIEDALKSLRNVNRDKIPIETIYRLVSEEGYTYAEVGRKLGLSRVAVRKRYLKLLKKLNIYLNQGED